MKNLFLALLLLSSLSGCKISKAISLAKQGNTAQEEFTTEIPFRYVKDHLFVDVIINGQVYNFLFDTGFDFTIIDEKLFNQLDNDRKSLSVQTTGSSFTARNIRYQPFDKITVAGIDFLDIGIGVTDLFFIQEDYRCDFIVHGVLGANLMRQAAWQIDYQQQVIRFSDDIGNLKMPDSSIPIQLSDKSWGNSRMSISLNGVSYDFLFDTGSSGRFTSGPEMLDQLIEVTPDLSYLTTECGSASLENPVYWKYDVVVNELTLGDMSHHAEILSLEPGVSSLIGNKFLKEYLVTIDWNENLVYLASRIPQSESVIAGFGVSLSPDYEQGVLILSKKIANSDLPMDLPLGAQVTHINGLLLDQFSEERLCQFWEVEWPELKQEEEIRLQFLGSDEEFLLPKTRFLPKE